MKIFTSFPRFSLEMTFRKLTKTVECYKRKQSLSKEIFSWFSSCTFVVVPGCIRTADQNIALTIAFTGETQYKQMAYGTDTGCFQPYFIKNISL